MKKFFYRVQKDDSVLGISIKFNVPTGKLIYDNNLRAEISEGDILLIETSEKKLYRVEIDDTIEKIAKDCNLSSDEILNNNHLPYIFYGILIEL